MTETIKDNEGYLEKMRKTFMDKAWFMSIIPTEVDTIIDFGCADGSFINYLHELFPTFRYIGVENNEKFTDILKQKGQEFYESLEDLRKNAAINVETSLLILNSVVHEIYSYSDIDKFWNEVKQLDVKFIAFRDMYAKGCGIYGSRTKDELIEEIIKSDFLRKQYKDFIKVWGDLNDGYTATHFLLKYFYSNNWDREVKENYIPYHYRELHQAIRKIGYNVTFERFYGLQYLKDKWHIDFNCENHPYLKSYVDKLTTHMKLFLVRETER